MKWERPPKEKVKEVVHLSRSIPPHVKVEGRAMHLLLYSAVVITVSGRRRTVHVSAKDDIDAYRKILVEGV